jgi:hypothetical protein
LVDNFELTSFEKDEKEEILHLYLKEIYSIPEEYRKAKLSSKLSRKNSLLVQVRSLKKQSLKD